jgi:Uncharacterized conserved protein
LKSHDVDIKSALTPIGASLRKWDTWKNLIMMLLGLLVGAAAVYYFLIPSKIVVGTVSGLAVVINSLLPFLKVSHIVLILNIVLVFLALFMVGKEFGINSIVASVLLGPAMDFCELICPWEKLAQPGTTSIMGDPWLDLCCFVLLLSASQAFLFRINASTGGLDIVAMILNKYFHIEIGSCVTIAGMVICGTAFFIPGNSFKMVVVGILGTWLNGVAIDHFTATLNRRKRVCIISSQHERIRRFIIEDLVRGCSLYEVTGGFKGEKNVEIQSLLTQHEYGKLMEFINKNKIDAFITAGNCSEVYGLWFQHNTQKRLKKNQ